MGGGLESGADCPPSAARLPGRWNNADQPRGHLPVALCGGRGALRRELTACLRTGRALRVPRARSRGRGKAHVGPEVLISERPAETGDRAVPGHWEGDLILGLGSSAIGTLVERTTRLTMLLHLPRMLEHGCGPRMKNGPALAGHGAEAVRDAIARTITTLPELLRQSLTWDQGTEMAQHSRLTIDTGLRVYFCDPHSPWQRGTNENTNGLLRQYFPKGTDLACTARTSLLPWPRRSMSGHGRRLAGERLPRCLTRCYNRFSLVLRRLVEPKLATLVAMMNDILGPPLAHGHLERVQHQLRPQMVRHGPADDLAAPDISLSTKSGAERASLSRFVVVTSARRRLAPTSPAARIRRATRLRPCFPPSARNAACTRGAPYVSRELAWTARTRFSSTASARAWADGRRCRQA